MIIESKRLILREWEYSDIDDLLKMAILRIMRNHIKCN